jgi:hypothetical protein
MMNMTRTLVATLTVLALGWTSAQAATIVFGNGNWAAQGVSDDVSSTATATIVDNGFTFTLGIALDGDNVGVANDGLTITEGGRNNWRNNPTFFTFTFSVVDANPSLDLDSLSVKSVVFDGINSSGEEVTISESATLR